MYYRVASPKRFLTSGTPHLTFVFDVSGSGLGNAGFKTRGARSKLVGMGPPPINLLFHEFVTSPSRRFLGRVDVLNHFEPALSV